MSFEAGHIMSAQFTQLMLGKKMINRLFYQIVATEVDIDLQDVMEALANAITLAMIPVQSENLQHRSQRFLDETDELGIINTDLIATGLVVGTDDLPTSNAFGGTKTVNSRLTRPGSIRVGGVTEITVTGNTIEPATLIALGIMGAVMADTLTLIDPTAKEFIVRPVVVGRLPDGSLDLARVQDVQFVGLWRATTQVSRR